jgi:molybdenum cofactor cytidylyltransferase
MTGGDPIARGDDRRGAAFAIGHDDDLHSDVPQRRSAPARGAGEPGRFAVVVLAAGAGERYGATKPLATVRGQPLVAHAVATALAADADPVVVVVGHDADRVAAAARAAAARPAARAASGPHGGGGVEVVTNPTYRSGQASSLATGIRTLLSHHHAVEVAVVLLADQPGVSPAAVRAVAAALGAVRGPGGARPDAARASYADGLGHPVAFRRSAWARLLSLTGDAGARHLLEDLEVVHVQVPGTVPVDVDTPDDLRRLRADAE